MKPIYHQSKYPEVDLCVSLAAGICCLNLHQTHSPMGWWQINPNWSRLFGSKRSDKCPEIPQVAIKGIAFLFLFQK